MPNSGAVNFRTSARRHRDNVSPPECHFPLTFSPHVTEQVECFTDRFPAQFAFSPCHVRPENTSPPRLVSQPLFSAKICYDKIRIFRILLPHHLTCGDLFPWRQASGAVKIDDIGKIALREKFITGKGITLQIFHSALM